MIKYATNPDKASDGDVVLETALNCSSVAEAYKEMEQTKKRWRKTESVECYHIIQSFKPNETTPELAHKIGIELARRAFGNYEVVIGTHLDRGHLHNHLVVNSVSFIDGSKYRRKIGDYFYGIRKTSDDICREYSLSVIDNPQARGKHYAEWKAEKDGKPTIRLQIRADIDAIIPRVINFNMFLGLLRKRGYKVKVDDNRKYIILLAPFANKPIRLSSKLGQGYSVDEITERIASSLYEPHQFIKPPNIRRYFCAIKPYPVRHYIGLQALYWRYVYWIRKVKNRTAPPKACAVLRTDVLKLEKYIQQHDFLEHRNLNTISDVANYQEKIVEVITQLTMQRNEKRGDENAEKIITQQLRKCREELRTCEKILKNHEEMQGNLTELLRQQKQKEAERQEKEVRTNG